MAGHILKRRRLVNPRRRMNAKQIRYFGTKRQKAALRRRNESKAARAARERKAKKWVARYHAQRVRERTSNRQRNQLGLGSVVSQAEHAASSAIKSVERAAEDAIESVTGVLHNRGRRRNVGEILTVIPANPGRRRRRRNRMAATVTRRRNRRRHRNRGRARNRRRHTTMYNPRRRNRRRNRRMSNPRVIVRYRNRRRNRRHNRRRNPNFLTGKAGAVIGILGGAAVTKLLTGFLPATITSGVGGYIATGVTAVIAGQIVGKGFKNPTLGNWVTIGGLLIVGLELIGKFIPSLQLPFGLSTGTSGLGLISSSNFYVPQVNLPGSMATFVTPAGVTGAIPVVPAAGMKGLGAPQFNPGFRTMRRIGRMR